MRVRRSSESTFSAIAMAFALVVVKVDAGLAVPSCQVPGADEAAVASARSAVQAACDCAGATSARSFRQCVAQALTGPAGEGLSAACKQLVRKIETRSTCGRPDRVVCCRTDARGRTKASLRRSGKCSAPPGGGACESPSPYLADGCTDGGCISPVCGDGVVEAGEGCDPPDGTSCSNECTSCAPAAAGEILLGCTAGSTGVAASAITSTLLVAYTDRDSTGHAAVAKRLDGNGAVLDAAPLTVSGPIPETSATEGFAETATTDGTDFYVGWSSFADFWSHFAGRRVPVSGAITSPIERIASDLPIGFCRVSMAGPLHLAPTLSGDAFLPTWRNVYTCGGDVLFETLTGVGNFFSAPPPGNLSSGPAPIIRAASDVAAVWRNLDVSSISPPVVQPTLSAAWIEPGPPSLLSLSDGFSSVSPALAAIGDTFVAVWATGNQVRVSRFTRASGALDPDGGLLIATGAGAIGQVAAAADGSHVVAVWREAAGAAQSAIRAIRIAPDGTLPSTTPIAVASSSADAAVGVAASSAATLVTFTRDESPGTSVRAVLLDD